MDLDGLSETERDRAWIARMLVGDHQALAGAYDCWAGFVLSIARRVTRNEQMAQDVTQDVFGFLWERPDRVDFTRGSLRSYLGMLCHRRAVDAVRHAEARHRSEARSTGGADRAIDVCDVEVVTADAVAWQTKRLAEVVALLPEDQRQALTLAYFHGRTYREVAAELNIPEGTAKSRLRLALSRLRDQLQNDDQWAWA